MSEFFVCGFGAMDKCSSLNKCVGILGEEEKRCGDGGASCSSDALRQVETRTNVRALPTDSSLPSGGMAPLKVIDVATHPARPWRPSAAIFVSKTQCRTNPCNLAPPRPLHRHHFHPALSFGSYLAFCVCREQDFALALACLRCVSFFEPLN